MPHPAVAPRPRAAILRQTLLALLLATCTASIAARDVHVASAEQLRSAVTNALAGDRILIAPGTYVLTSNVVADTPASSVAPIVVRAVQPRSVLLQLSNGASPTEGFRILAPHWRFEGLDIEGACATDDSCEHAFHLSGDADFFVLRDSVVRDFNAQIKSNGQPAGGSTPFPDDVLIERNRLYDTHPRDTGRPVTKIDVVGGRRWIVRGNVIHDFQKLGGDTVSYAAFLKGNSSDGVFERNLVQCARDFSGGVRLGLSLGGGGTGATFCEGGSCNTEHRNGTLRNNIIIHCNDVGIYLNRAADTRVLHNTLFDTSGIDVRFPTSSADLRNNLVSGAIRNRDGGSSTQAGNLVGIGNAPFAGWFVDASDADFTLLDGAAVVDAGVATPEVDDDYCANQRDDALPDIGALEYDDATLCDTTRTLAPRPLFADGFEG